MRRVSTTESNLKRRSGAIERDGVERAQESTPAAPCIDAFDLQFERWLWIAHASSPINIQCHVGEDAVDEGTMERNERARSEDTLEFIHARKPFTLSLPKVAKMRFTEPHRERARSFFFHAPDSAPFLFLLTKRILILAL